MNSCTNYSTRQKGKSISELSLYEITGAFPKLMALKNHNISNDILLEILSKYQYTKIEEIKVKDYKTIVNTLNSILKEDSSNE